MSHQTDDQETTMNSERQHSRASSADTDGAEYDKLEAGRISRSALLRKPDDAIGSGLVQRKARDANGVAEGADDAVAAASTSSGAPLPGELMRKFEGSLGVDLSGVRVHTGDASASANEAVGAKAYTIGQDIHFGSGQYDPSSPGGEHLLAHEVAHTVQQADGAKRMQFQLAVSSPGDSLEHEADRAAEAMVVGAPATISGASPSTSRMAFREAAKPPDLKYVQQVLTLGETTLAEKNFSFIKASLKACSEFKGTIGEKSGQEGGKVDGLIKTLNNLVTPKLTLLSFNPNGWLGIKELTGASLGVGKGTLGKIVLFKGQVYADEQAVGEVTISISGVTWDEKSVKVGVTELAGELILASFDALTPLADGRMVGAGSKIVAGLKGSVGIDVAQAILVAGGKLAGSGAAAAAGGATASGGAGVAGTNGLSAAMGAFGTTLLVGATGVAVIATVHEIMDDLDGDNIAKEALMEADRLAIGFDREMKDPGHKWKPSPFFNKDPYLRGVEMASQIKSDFFNRFLADPRVEAWKAAHPDKGQQMQQLESVYRKWVKQDEGARGAIAFHAAKVKSQTKQAGFAERFLAYAARARLSGPGRVLKLFDQLWPASWMDDAKTMPMFFNVGVPKACYDVVSSIDPKRYPKDLKKWVNPPTLL